MLDFGKFKLDTIEDEENIAVEKTYGDDIAVIGISGRFPMADNIDEYWQNICDGKDCIRNIPESRKKDADILKHFSDFSEYEDSYIKAGYIDEIDKFDYGFFNLTPKEASLMSPQQKLFLENVFQCIEDGGYGGGKLAGSDTGIYVGVSDLIDYKYIQYTSKAEPDNIPISISGNLSSIIPSRISYILDFNGPSMLIDTACSSSLVAIHLACQGILKGECKMAIAGGVRISLLPLESMPKVGIESSDGITKTFDENADGTGIGEGVASILLKPLSKAILDNDNIYAVIKGSAVNQDGNCIGITAPNAVAQAAVIEKAINNSNINAETISYIEVHGTATKLGDPIEIDGIERFFRKHTDKKQFCAVSTIKTNIGHLYDASGIAGIIKAILALEHKKLPPSINFNFPNEKINFEESPIYINDKLREWKTNDIPRRCGVSSFGMSGTNCHVILEEYVDKKKDFDNNVEKILILSAKSKKSLLQLINDYSEFFKKNDSINIDNVCYTSNTGRGHYNYRLAIIFNSVESLKEKIKELNMDFERVSDKDIYFGNFKINKSKVELSQKANKMLEEYKRNRDKDAIKEICSMYVQGVQVNWDKLYDENYKKVSIPTYAFEKNRCWLDLKYNIGNLSNKKIDYNENIINMSNDNGLSNVKLVGKTNNIYSDIEERLAQIFMEVTGFNEINIHENFSNIGADSIMLAKAYKLVEKGFPGKVAISDFFSHPNIYELAKIIQQPNKIINHDSNSERESLTMDIAIIGISLKFPMADSLNEYWEKLKIRKDFITEFPEDRRRDVDFYAKYLGTNSGETKYENGSYLSNVDKFDYKFFNISPKEASLMDPNQRIFMEVAYKAIEDSGYGGQALKGTKTGVYVGYGNDPRVTYGKLVYEIERSSASLALPGNISSIIPSRISYLLDLKGPSMVIDTACSSSLVAIHMACKGLKSKDCNLAIAGGIKINLLPIDDEDTKLGIESSKTKAFDENADGTVSGEGIAALVLKPLDQAMKDKDNIYAVIKGSAVNQDGTSMGITAPNAISQAEVIIDSWKNSNVEPETITYIETHGTGTKLGDPIEIDGLQKAFRQYTNKKQFCALGAVKANIGHLYEASGMASIIKAIACLKYKQLPPIINFSEANRKINFEESPFYINSRLSKWNVKGKRRCGISSFGLSGTNCHVILEEAPEFKKELSKSKESYNVLTLSAKSKKSLELLIRNYTEFINQSENLDLEDLCFTANTGRGHYEYRLAVIIGSQLDLKNKMKNIYNKGIDNILEEGVYFGKHKLVSTNKEIKGKEELTEEEGRKLTIEVNRMILSLIEDEKQDPSIFKKICKLYIKGAQVDWTVLYSNQARISLPVYPFEENRCWIKIPEKGWIEQRAINTLLGVDKIPLDFVNELKPIFEKWKGTSNIFKGIEEKESRDVELIGNKSEIYSKTEIEIAQIFGEVLGFHTLGLSDNIFELGADSILVTKIANSINKNMNININIKSIFEYATVEELAKYIEKNIKKEKRNIFTLIQKSEAREYYELSSAQKRMYIVNHLKGIGVSYNLPVAIMSEGELDYARIQSVYNQLINRHDVFRTVFELKDNNIVGKILDNVEPKIIFMESNEEKLNERINEFVYPFNLKKAPLIRMGIIQINEKKNLIIFDMHHIISDWTSLSILAHEFMTLYQGEKLDELEIQYKDFAIWQNKLLQSEAMKKEEEYWLSKFSRDIPRLDLPTDYERLPDQSFEGTRIVFEITGEFRKKIYELVEQDKVTLYTVLLAVYNILLFKYTGNDDIIVGSPISGRNHPQMENIIGVFINTLAMRNYPKGDKKFIEFLDEVKENSLDAFDNSNYPFDRLVEKLGLQTDRTRNPLFDTMFALQNIGIPKMEVNNLKLTPYALESDVSQFDLSFEAVPWDEKIIFNVDYCTRLFKEDTINKIIEDYKKILFTVIENKYINIKDIEVVSEYTKIKNNLLDDIDFEF